MSTTPEDAETPNVARIYDYLLGGAHSFQADRDRADELVAAYPNIVPTAWANRTFLRHAVEHALDLGIDQFIDLGSGIPTVGNVHEVAHRRRPTIRVAYVDDEPVAVAHSATLLTGLDTVTITEADLRDPEAVLAAPGVAGLLDLARPVALLAVAALHFEPDDERLATVLRTYRDRLAPGSLLALTHNSADYPDRPDIVEGRHLVTRLYASTSNPAYDRSRAQLRALLDAAGFTPNADGLVEVSRWAPPDHRDDPLGMYAVISEPL